VPEAAVGAALDPLEVLLQRRLGLGLEVRVDGRVDAQPAGVEQLAEALFQLRRTRSTK
jgi:hypothetical protein